MTLRVAPKFKNTLYEDAVAKTEQLLGPAQLARLRERFDRRVANPGPSFVRAWDGTSNAHHIDNGSPAARKLYDELMPELPYAGMLANARARGMSGSTARRSSG